MTTTTEQPPTRQIVHPEWCGGGHPNNCEVDRDENGFVQGDHRGLPTRVKTYYGPTLAIELTANVGDENNPTIALRIPAPCGDDLPPFECEHAEHEGHYTFAGTAQLEPEEAMMLARRLTEAVAEWHAARRDHPTSR